ncbi:ATP-binding protein [Ramlibacter humi]|uniref:histidine kinase n=1 Tax=Ramlibacter humi TaxID=2530451 RepID=A0A4Z0CAE7_9BURK|nr:ATP-binding protein [Ramlibacter humi]TFZ07862.1 hybrid sensor histidine kinase/response regulator [Ramlibacter humi]
MPSHLRAASIRARLILLVLALWLPAVAGLGLQARDTYLREEAAARDDLRQLAGSLAHSAEAELDRRMVLARVLAASPSLRTRDLAAFHAQAREAVEGTGLNVMLVDRTRQRLHTAQAAPQVTPRTPGAVFSEHGPVIAYVPRDPITGQPAIGLFLPEPGTPAPEFNVGVTFSPAAVQAVAMRPDYPEGALASIVDARQRVMARSRDPEKWLGARASNTELLARAERGGSGFVETTTLDGVSSLTFLTPPNRYGWAAIVALPQSALRLAAQRIALQAIGASAVLLVTGLAIALLVARRISRPVLALEQAAGELLAQRVPEPLRTGLAEVDRVGAVLHDAGVRARESERVLEARVAEAVSEVRQAESRLFEARKHEAIGRLTGGVAHDFNNLLQTISMGLQVVQRGVPEGRHTRPLQAALAACGKAADLVRQMLAFGRAQQLRPQPVDLADLLLRSRDLTGKALGERIRLVADLNPSLPPVLADPTQLELALLNLVFNARDAMPEGGSVTVSARPADSGEIGLEDRAFVRIDVRDSGHGMDGDTLSRVFEPYFTTKPVGRGTGLGLPQVQAFARQSGGDVRIASTPGEGTTVTMYLLVSSSPAETELPVQPAIRRPRRSLRVVMVEDDVLVASVVPAALEHEGHRVTLCRTADEARLLLAQGLAADVLFTDVVMPGSMTGLELVAWCRENRPELPALVATGYSARPPEGVWKLLCKPYVIEDLLDALDVAASAAEPA